MQVTRQTSISFHNFSEVVNFNALSIHQNSLKSPISRRSIAMLISNGHLISLDRLDRVLTSPVGLATPLPLQPTPLPPPPPLSPITRFKGHHITIIFHSIFHPRREQTCTRQPSTLKQNASRAVGGSGGGGRRLPRH